ncbi:MAG: glycosyltransferase family 4 protein [Acidobacteriota bacterium]
MRSANRSKHRILFLDYTNGIGLGGGQRSLQLLLEELDRDRFELMLACPREEQILNRIPHDVRVYPLDLPPQFRSLSRRGGRWRHLLASLPGVCELRRSWGSILRQAQPGLIHANNLKMLFLAAVAEPRSRVPRLWHVRDILPRNPMTQALKRTGARISTRVLAVSKAVARELPPSAPSVVFYNAVRLPPLDRLAALRRDFRERHRIGGETCLIGYAGRLDSGKGLNVLLDAFCQLSAAHPALELMLAGQGPLEDALAPVAALRGAGGRVRMVGFQPDMAGAWSAMDIAVVPSTEPDSFPRSAVEAMAYSLPVVGSDTGGIGESIASGETGSLVAPGDAGALAEALRPLVRDADLRRVQGNAGRLRCEKLFSARAQAQRLASIYDDVLEAA